LTFEGQPLNHDGWTFAVDFPRQYYSKMSTFHVVRRRKWVRFRKYCALNSWCAISPLHKDPTEEPFIDCSVSGTSLESGLMLVWAVTSHGRVMFRSGVSIDCPEGKKWITVLTECEISQISVGTYGLVWAACLNGRALVRSGVTRDNPMGKTWLEVKPPGNNLKLVQISVGINSVWAITNDYSVWFRKSVNGVTAGISENSAIGSGWIEMVGKMSSISVTGNDQVFAVGNEDRNMYFRFGVTLLDPTGKKWKKIQCHMQMSTNTSSMNLSRRSSAGSPNRHRSYNILKYQHQESHISIKEVHDDDDDNEEQSRSAPIAHNRQKVENWQKAGLNNVLKETSENIVSSCPVSNEVYEITGKQLRNPKAWSPVRSVGSVVGIEAHPESDSTVFEAESSNRDSGVFGEDDFIGSQYWTEECDVNWTNVAAGAAILNQEQLPNWFNETLDESNNETTKPWRNILLENLKQRNQRDTKGFEAYEQASDTTSWIKSGEARLIRYNKTFEDCRIELEWVSSAQKSLDCGTFSVLNSDGVSTKIQFLLNEITCVMTCSEPGYPRIAIFSPRLTSIMSPLKLQFSCDSDLEDWLSHLTSVTCRLNNVDGCPKSNSIWITNSLGEVFVADPANVKDHQLQSNGLFSQEIDVSTTETPYLIKLINGMPIGSFLRITGCVYDDADQIRFDLQSHATIRLRHKSEHFRNMPLHLNPRFHENCIVLNSMEMSNWEKEIRDSRMLFSPGKEFDLIVKTESNGFRIIVDEKDFITFKYRNQKPETIISMHCSGRVKLFNINYQTTEVIFPLNEIFWRQMGGHLRRVEACAAGMCWGIGYDHSLYSYTKGNFF
jgi:tectonin beta-propeller repeat-containing protein 1